MNAAIILARLDSLRFPGKSLTKIGDKTLIEWCVDNIKQSKYFTPILATSSRAIDEPLIELANRIGIDYFRGDIDNIALRVKKCIDEKKIDVFARVNGDSPFVRAELLDEGFEKLLQSNADFVTNLIPRAFPYGISVEIIKSEIFIDYFNKINNSKIYQEHIFSFFYDNLKEIAYQTMPYRFGNNDHNIRLTIDTIEDKEYILNFFQKHADIFQKNIQEIIKIFKGK